MFEISPSMWSHANKNENKVIKNQTSIVLVYSSEFFDTSIKLPFIIPTAVVKQIAKVHGPVVSLGNCASDEICRKIVSMIAHV